MSKKKVVSLSMSPEMHENITLAAKKEGVPLSNLVCTLIDKYLGLLVNDGEEIPIIIKIPVELRTKEEEFRQFMSVKSEAIVGALKK